MLYPSKRIEDAVNQLASLPGIGRKTALRLALSLLKRDSSRVKEFSEALVLMKENTCFCSRCHNISDTNLCLVCSNSSRDGALICIVADFRDVIAIENTHSFNGLYHVLGGLISPMDGIGPSELNIESLIERLRTEDYTEIIFALAPTPDGDTTNFFIYRKVKDFPIRISSLARGIAIGEDIEYTDQATLGKSLQNRILYESSLAAK